MSRSRRRHRNACCSFCRKSHTDVGPLVEGPDDAYICGECIELCQEIIDQEKVRRSLVDNFGYYRSKVERLTCVFEQAKWENDNLVASSHPLPIEVVEKVLFHLSQIKGLLGDRAKP